MASSAADRLLVQRIRAGDAAAWRDCIQLYEGRLLAFVVSRLKDRAQAEDLVQETFLGFLTALPNFDEETPVEAFLFAIAAHKMTDVLRRSGRRPKLPLPGPRDSNPGLEPAGPGRAASSLARSEEQRGGEESLLAGCLQSLIEQWLSRGDVVRLKCAELILVKGMPNRDVARTLGITEQEVANHKAYVVGKLKDAARRSSFPSPRFSWMELEDSGS